MVALFPLDVSPTVAARQAVGQPPSGGGATISCDFDVSPMSSNGCTFECVASSNEVLGNGDGIMKIG